MEMKRVLKQEGRDAKNLVAYQISVDEDISHTQPTKKPPSIPKIVGNAIVFKNQECQKPKTSGPRVRSASTGRDKKSELQARYWALLFGNLQRAVNEIYQTVECYENMSSCQEAILVLENYIRDFKALAEWFRVSWDYESTPLPQRPQSLAWEVRKSNPLPRVRAKSLTSPTVSGKSSPSFSGMSSPCSAIEDNKNSPRKKDAQKGGTRVNIRELFSSKPLKKFVEQQQNVQEQRAEEKPEEDEKQQKFGTLEVPLVQTGGELSWNEIVQLETNEFILDKKRPDVENQSKCSEKCCNEEQLAKGCCALQENDPSGILDRDQANNECLIEVRRPAKHDQYAQTDLEDENLTLAEFREKLRAQEEQAKCSLEVEGSEIPREPTAVELTVQKMNSIENQVLSKDAAKLPTNPDTEIKKVSSVISKSNLIAAAKASSEAVRKPLNSPLKYSSVLNRPISTVSANTKSVGMVKVNNRPTKPSLSVQAIQKSATTSSMAPANVSTRRTPVRSATTPNVNRLPAGSYNPPPLVRNSSNLTRSDRWVPSNVANRLSARSRTMIDMNEKSRGQRTSLINSRKASREDIGSSNSTLKASNEKLSGSKLTLTATSRTVRPLHMERKSEPKQLPQESGNNDGWFTVKNRRRSSLHWSNRFNQPTGYASLPTLALLNEKDEQHGKNLSNKDAKKPGKDRALKQKTEIVEETKPVKLKSSTVDVKVAKPKCNPAALRVSQKVSGASKSARETTGKNNPVNTNASNAKQSAVSRQSIIKRQKSDLTGLKMTSLHNEYLRSEKLKGLNLGGGQGDGLTSAVDTDEQNKIDIKIQTNRDFSKTIGDLYDSCVGSQPNGLHDLALSSCDECEEKDDLESDEDQRKLLEEQESLERQILELQNTEIDVDTETDETDCEVMIDHEDKCEEATMGERELFVDDENLSLEMRYHSLLSEMSWGEREEALATLQAYVSRHPGRAQELHQKLSSPSRRRSLQETLKKYQAKQARAKQKRELLQKEKALKIQHLLTRVEDVKAAKQQLIEEKRLRMEERLQRAAENRNQYLKDIIRKAHDEEEKLKEIAFIKNLEAQNKRLDFIESCREQEGRLQDLEQERQKKVEEKAAKEAAVERRRQEIEQARQRRLEKMNKTRLEREQRVGKMQEQRERQRQAIAREKARDREERLLALQVQQQQTTEELQRKILQKQKESARRHEENIEHIRQRALELSIPNRNQDENGPRDDSEERNDGGDLSSTVSDVSKEHTKAFKKKMKKLKQRMTQGAEEYFKELQPVPLHMKRESQIPKLLNLVNKGGGSQGLERPLGQILRLMSKAQVFDFQCFWLLDGLGAISKVIARGMEPNSEVTKRAVVIAVQLYRNACSLCPQIARHGILGNSVPVLFDSLLQSLQLPEEKSPQHPVELSTELMLACTVILSSANSMKQSHPKVLERLPDLISYAVITGLIEVLSRRCMKIRESIESHQSVVLSLLATLGLLTKFVEQCPPGPADTTKFLNAAKSTELFGSISLLHSSVVPVGECIPPRTISLAAATFNLLVSMAVLDLNTFQEVLSGECLSMRYLDVITILLKYCGSKCTINEKNETQAVIIDLIATIGFFCANNKKNQDLLTSEQCSIVVKSLTKLPEYFNAVVFPTLVTITHENSSARKVISRDFNMEFLEDYKKSEKGQKNRLVTVLKTKL